MRNRKIVAEHNRGRAFGLLIGLSGLLLPFRFTLYKPDVYTTSIDATPHNVIFVLLPGDTARCMWHAGIDPFTK